MEGPQSLCRPDRKTILTRYNEHKSTFHHNNRTSNFAKHLHDNLHSHSHLHSFGPINDIMQMLHHQKKGAHLNTIERFHIHIVHAADTHINDDHTIFPNKIFDALIKLNAPHTP
jgi:hypothetical protein